MSHRGSFTTQFHAGLRQCCPCRLCFGIALLVTVVAFGIDAEASEPDVSPAQAPTEVDAGAAIVVRSRVFDIPFHVDGGTKAKTVTLHVSSDAGSNWSIVETKQIPIDSFHFESPVDGEYWFTHTTDLDGPAATTELTPQRRILIDSTGPKIELDGEADLGGTLRATLRLTDPKGIASLRVLYATDSVREWVTIPNQQLDEEGNFQVLPDQAWQQLSVHVTCTDTLGNASVQSKKFRRPRVADSQPANRLRTELQVQTAAAPSDPPKFFFGPGAAARPNPTAPTLEALAPSPSEQLGGGTETNQKATGTFGSGFDTSDAKLTRNLQDAAQTLPAPVTMSETNARKPAAPADVPQTLPSEGVEARLTPNGLEVIAAPEPDAIEELPSPKAVAEESNSNLRLNEPATRDPGAPITEAIPTPKPAVDPNAPRTLSEAMRPMQSTPGFESIPAPSPELPSRESMRAERQRVEEFRAQSEANQRANRETQQRFDLAQLDRGIPFRYSDSNQFSLEYELEAIGELGAQAIELYGSLDGGETWERWGADRDGSSPFDIETKGEGVFAFRMVVLGNNGLSSPRPLSGDSPDIAVVVDQQLPQVKITSARYGRGDRTGSLIVEYECEDDHLMTRPIAISFSDSLEGPWTTIAAGLRNDGSYVWPADPQLPPRIFLRVDATDKAGNIGTYLLDQPIATGGLAPRARILGFRSR